MLRIIFVIVILGAYEYHTCFADSIEADDDWRKKGFYRPRRNYPSQSQIENSFQTSHSHNYQSQNSFNSKLTPSSTGASNRRNYDNQNPFGINSQNTHRQNEFSASNSQPFGIRSQNFKPELSRTSFGQNQGQDLFGTNHASHNAFETRTSQNSFATNNNQIPSSNNQNSFVSDFGQQQKYNTFKTNNQNFAGTFSQNTQRQKSYENGSFGNFGQNGQNYFRSNSYSQNAFALQNATASHSSFNFGSNSAFTKGQNYKAPGYLPPFKGPEYLPPEKQRTTFPPYVPLQSTTTKRPYFTTTTTKRPFFTTRFYTITTTRQPFFTTTTTRRPFFTTKTTQRPFFTTTTTKRPTYTTTTQKTLTATVPKPSLAIPVQADDYVIITVDQVSPAMAMKVPPEPEDDDGSDRTPLFLPAMAMKVPPEPEDDDDSNRTPQVPPTMAMEVPVEPDDDDGEIVDDFRTTTTKKPFRNAVPAPAMAIPVPPEEDDPTTTTTSATPSTTLTTTILPTSISTTQSTTLSTTLSTTTITTTPSTTPATSTSTTPPTTTTAPTTTTTPSTTTTTPSTTSTTTPSTTTTTTPSTTTTTTTPSTTTTTLSTTTTTTPSTTITSTSPSTTTTTTTTTTPSTTPPTTSTTTPSTTPPTTSTTTPITTTPDPNRILEEQSSPTTQNTPLTTPSDDPFQAPPYLPPKNITSLPPKPALAMIVPPEPECDPLDPSTYPSEVDQRSFGDNPCTPTTTTTTVKPVFRGPLYLPPPPKTRVGRSSNNTLSLGDLKGTPRPVWYAGIYKKTTDPYLPICGGSIIREDVVISAAHCFWDDVVGKQPAALFAVAANKIYKPWRDPMDKKAQKTDVLDIMIPPRFLGAKTSFQEDLAILRLATPFKYARGLRPICVDFDVEFDREQMKAGHQGTIAGWGYTDAVGTPTQRLLWLELPYVEIEKCIRDSEDSFLKYITCDKVCAGENDTGKALCRGDSGGGLAFWQGTPARGTPYLRGVASTAPSRRNAECNVFAYGSFTHVRAHRTFLRDHVPDIEECRFWE